MSQPPQIKCQQCGGEMIKTKRVEKNLGLQVLGVLLFLVGLVLCFTFGVLGVIAGVILMIASARLGYQQKKVWQCRACGYFYERAD